jgi:hypothetical protein
VQRKEWWVKRFSYRQAKVVEIFPAMITLLIYSNKTKTERKQIQQQAVPHSENNPVTLSSIPLYMKNQKIHFDWCYRVDITRKN